MKRIIIVCYLVVASFSVRAQSQEIQQLLLNVEKLAQFKQILADLKKGYNIVSTGYTTIKDLSEGNFSLHKTFLDGLLQVSPAVRRYKRIADIVSLQVRLVQEYKGAYRRFRQHGDFTPQELSYLGKTYDRLFTASVKNLDDLFMVVTAGQLRMSDEERLTAIDKIYGEMQDKITFLRQFNNSTTILAVQRAKEQNEVDVMRKLYDIED